MATQFWYIAFNMLPPGLISQCKLCTFIKSNKSLWVDLHRKVLDDNMAITDAVRWFNGKIEVLNAGGVGEQLPVFTNDNFYRHFRDHVRTVDEMNQVLSASLSIQSSESASEAQELNEILEESKSLRALIISMERRIQAYDDELTKREENAAENEGINIYDLGNFQKLIGQLLKLKKEAADIQRSQKVVGSAMKEALEHLVEKVMDKAVEVSIETKNLLVRELPHSNLPVQVSDMIKSYIGDGLKSSIPDILSYIERKYSIK